MTSSGTTTTTPVPPPAGRPASAAPRATGGGPDGPPDGGTVGSRLGRAIGRWAVPVLGGLAFIYLLVPIAYIFVFSFNQPARTNLTWRGFTWENWQNPCGAPAVCASVQTSLQVGLVATAIALVLGTLLAYGLGRYAFRFRDAAGFLIFLPLATPEVVLGASLLSLFLNVGMHLGFWTVVLAHVMFCMSFVVVTIRSRVSTLDPRLEEAGRDLYGSPAQVFLRVTLPQLVPGILAAGLLSFAMSFDDFIITNFTSGTLETFPKFVYVAAARGIPAEANVIGSAMFLIALMAVIVIQLVSWQRRRMTAGPR
ncbi:MULTISPECIES: ABC transporter permease [Micrococcaceae]|uniref:ABC transporter permease n=1 Tax=Micrococcaceae TaxID=1268 RepID=UPI0017DCFEC2|nr:MULTISPECIES: ABC transporter permease [Micrococcaceae]MBB5749902.1 spermidine/putrescine transport system permease protein [Micrococcus sp. TA1]HRO29216.1 ABC transporter permease [Citricoccus sp.]HRO92751.1 ABC transporter permease [Citricoccus sp.]